MKAKDFVVKRVTLPEYVWRTPLVDNSDPVIAMAAKEYITAKDGAPYTIGGILAFLRRRVPQLRTEIATAAAAKRKRAHGDAVDAVIHRPVA